MTTAFITGKDQNGVPIAYANEQPFSDINYSATLTANTPLTTIVPPNINIAVFKFPKASDVYVTYNGATYPISDNLLLEDGTALLLEDSTNIQLEGAANLAGLTAFIDLNPLIRTVVAGTQLSFLSSDAAKIVVSYYNRATPGKIGYQ